MRDLCANSIIGVVKIKLSPTVESLIAEGLAAKGLPQAKRLAARLGACRKVACGKGLAV